MEIRGGFFLGIIEIITSVSPFGQQLCWQAENEPGAARKGWNAAGVCNLVVQLAATIMPHWKHEGGKKNGSLFPPYADQTAITSL